MSTLHFVGGEKGGVGKSVMARLLAQYYIDRGVAFQAFDADPSHGAMRRYYEDFSSAVDLAQTADADRIMECALTREVQVIVDLAAQTDAALYGWMDETGLPELCGELGVNITMWHVMDDGTDSPRLLERLIGNYGSAARYVVVRNHGRGSDFSAFDNSNASRLAAQHNAQLLDLRELHASTMRSIDRINASFWAAANNPESGLGMMERQRVRIWLRKTYADLDHIHSVLQVQPGTED